MVGERIEVGADVTGHLGPAMDPADATGGEHRHTRRRSQRDRCRHRGRPERPSLSDRNRQVTLSRLAGFAEDAVVLVGSQAHPGDTVENGGDGGHRSAFGDSAQASFQRLGVGG